jgi:formate hydrogenlyase subunit 6/NADH:ubiquinone oxidoreductase subunit I
VRYPKLRELGEAIKALCSKPYTSDFPKKPHVPHPNFRGQPEFDQDKCLGCLACEEACPSGAIAHEDITDPPETAKRRMIHYTDTCIYCSQCEAACIANHEGIKLGNKWELSYFDRSQAFEFIEKDLQLCEGCGTVIATKDHLNWLADQLGEMAFSNPTVYLARLAKLGVAQGNIAPVLKDRGRSDRVKILCVKCRRETTRYDD